MSQAYADTSFLVAMFVNEPRSEDAIERLTSLEANLFVGWFSAFEFRNTVRRLGFRNVLRDEEVAAVIESFDEWRNDGRLTAAQVPTARLAARAESLSHKTTPQIGARGMDLLHVAFAIESSATIFLTYDQRQARVARSAGLQTQPP